MNSFTRAYIHCALWSSSDDNDDSLFDRYGLDDIDSKTLSEMKQDCERFIEGLDDLISPLVEDNYVFDDDQAGHDFWLTRNGHGAGFWDGDWPEAIETILDDRAKSFRTFDLYIGDDGKIHGY